MSAVRTEFIRKMIRLMPEANGRDIWAYFGSMHYGVNETADDLVNRCYYPGLEEEVQGAFNDHLQQNWERWQQQEIDRCVPKSKSIDGSTIAGLMKNLR